MQKTSVIGTGSWGAALAKSLNADEHIAGRSAARNIDADYVVIAVEAQKFREVITKHKFAATSKIIICCKGIEQGSLKLMSEVLEEVLTPHPTSPLKGGERGGYAILSGPNFADEIAAGLPSATSISSKDPELAKEIIKKFGKPNFRMYFAPDIISTQIGGALKNVIAIASGICAGKNLGENARAAVITRGIAEMAKLTKAKGGDERYLMGLCGFGDLMLTANSVKSRNFRFGVGVGSGAEEAKTGVIEGYYSAKSVYELAKKLNIEMPICFSVYEVLYNNKNIDEAINDLLERPQG